MKALAYLGLGSNLGDRRRNIEAAVAALRALPGSEIIACARLLETPPLGPPGQGDYLNTVCGLKTGLAPRELLRACQAIEARLGRPPPPQRQRWGARVIDLDLLLYDNLVLRARELTVPHPRMRERRFVLAPLCEIAPGVVDPETGLTAAQLLARLEGETPRGGSSRGSAPREGEG